MKMANSLLVTELISGPPKYSNSLFTAGISRYPTTPGQHIVVLHSPYLFDLSDVDQSEILRFVYQFANEARQITKVKRCGFAYDGRQCLHIIPMHGLNDNWEPILAQDTELDDSYPGYLWTKGAPHMDKSRLDETQSKLAKASGWKTANYTFLGDDADDNLFARLTRGQIPQWRVWENDHYLAFLTPFPNTPGSTVLIPRQHLPSDVFGLEAKDYDDLMIAAREVVQVMQTGLEVENVGMFFEGFEIDYTHVKFVPIIGPGELEGPTDEFYETYPGYISTRLGTEIDPASAETYR